MKIAKEAWKEPWVRSGFVLAALIIGLILCTGLALLALQWLLDAVMMARDILVPFALALITAYIFAPVIDAMEKRGLSRWGAIALLGGLAAIAAASAILLIAPVIVRQALEQGDRLVTLATEKVKELLAEPDTIPPRVREWMQVLPALLEEYWATALKSIFMSALQWLSVITRTVYDYAMLMMGVVLYATLTIYLLKDFRPMVRSVSDCIPAHLRPTVSRLAKEIDDNLRAFFRGQLIVAACLGILYAVGLVLVGINFGFLIGLFAGLASIVPYLGLAVGMIPALLIALIQYWPDLWPAVGVLLVFGIGQAIEGLVLTPKLVGDKVGLSPVVIILAILLCGRFLGFFGVLFAVPIAAILKVLFLEALRRYKASSLFTGVAS